MNNGNGTNLQMPWYFNGEMAAAMWANLCLMSLQMMYAINRAGMTVAMSSCAAGLNLTRSLYESAQTGNASLNG